MTRRQLTAVALTAASIAFSTLAATPAFPASNTSISSDRLDTSSAYPEWAEKALAGKGTGGGR